MDSSTGPDGGATGSTVQDGNSTGTDSGYIITIDQLTSTQGAIVQQQSVDLSALQAVFQPDPNTLKSQLISWAAQGFPSDWVVFSVQVSPPPVCDDGKIRGFYDYAQYLLGTTIQAAVTALSSQVFGVTFNFFLKDVNTLGLNVSKA